MLLRGNQGVGNMSVSAYPKSHWLAYRWPSGMSLPAAEV
jgi:hypothetical protein